MRIIRRRPSPAMVVALIALFVALGGPAQARKLVDGKLLRKGSVTGRAIKDGSIARADLTKATVRSLTATPANSVRSAQIADGQILAPDLGIGVVGSAQLASGAVSASKLAADSVGGGSVANGSLQTVDIGSFAGSVVVDFGPFDNGVNRCRVADAAATPAGGGAPNLGDDVIAISPPTGFSDYMTVNARPLSGNVLRIRACWIPNTDGNTSDPANQPPDPPALVFRYVSFDAP